MDSAAIEQMNKLRKSLGLPLLGNTDSGTESNGLKFKEQTDDAVDEEPASTLETREAAGYQNFKGIQEGERKQLERQQRKKALQRARDAADRFKRLGGKGLGEAEDEDENVDAKSWLKGQKKRQKDIEKDRAKRLEDELSERERQAAIEYTSADLAGVQVAHEIGDFEDGVNEQILTLKDKEIGKDDESDDGDILENAELIAQDRLQEKLDAKKKIRYDVHDDENKGLLAQYDEKKRKAFTLDAQGSGLEERESKRQQIGEKLKNTISLDILKAEPVSDYQEIRIKKPKKTKKKNMRQKELDEDEVFPANGNTNGDSMDVDVAAPTSRSRADNNNNINDDEDLVSALQFSRRAALKKKKLRPEDIVKQLREEDDTETPEVEGALTLDDTTNFLDNLEARPRDAVPETIAPSAGEFSKQEPSAEDEDEHMSGTDQAYTIVEGDEQALLEGLKKEQTDADGPSLANPTGLEEEQTLSNGLGATLNLLRSRGVIKTEEDMSNRNSLYRARQKFIIEARLREHDSEAAARAQRERDRASGKHQGMSTREREEQARWQNEQRSQQSSIAAAAAFNKEYKPDVNIKYVDDQGRTLNRKEAFKHLSHQFHGKGSGKQKTEKHLKKIEEEHRRDAKSVLDSSTDDRGMQRAQGTVGKRDKIAGVRLG